MLLNKGEAILCHDEESARRLLEELQSAGYRWCNDEPLLWDEKCRGVRWASDDDFPDCVVLVSDESFDGLAEKGRITAKGFYDTGVEYQVRWYNAAEALPTVEDLL